MSDDLAFWRNICKALQAEATGDKSKALEHLDRAEKLACCRDAQLQIEAWRGRLVAAEIPPPGQMFPDEPRPRKRRTKTTPIKE